MAIERHEKLAYSFHHDAATGIIDTYVYVCINKDHAHERSGWYFKAFNRPEDMRTNEIPAYQPNHDTAAMQQVEADMYKQDRFYGAADIMDLLRSKEDPLSWSKVTSPPMYKENPAPKAAPTRKTAKKKAAPKRKTTKKKAA